MVLGLGFENSFSCIQSHAINKPRRNDVVVVILTIRNYHLLDSSAARGHDIFLGEFSLLVSESMVLLGLGCSSTNAAKTFSVCV